MMTGTEKIGGIAAVESNVYVIVCDNSVLFLRTGTDQHRIVLECRLKQLTRRYPELFTSPNSRRT